MSEKNKKGKGFIRKIMYVLLGIIIIIGLFYLWLALTR